MDDNLKIDALYDSGSNVSLINQRIADLVKLRLIEQKNILKTIGGSSFTSTRALIKIRIGNITDYITTYVVKNGNFSYDLLLGLDAIKKFQLIQDENLKIFQRIHGKEMRDLQEDQPNNENQIQVPLNDLDEIIEVNFDENLNIDDFHADLNHIENEKKKQTILQLIEKYRHLFAKDKFDIGK